MNTSINLLKSFVIGNALAYGGQYIGKSIIRNNTPQKTNDNSYISKPIFISSLSTLAVMASPVPMRSISGGIATFGLGFVLGALSEWINKGGETDSNTDSNESDNNTKNKNNNKKNENNNKKNENNNKTNENNNKTNENTRNSVVQSNNFTEARRKESLKEWEKLTKEDQKNFSKFIKEMGIGNKNIDFDMTLTPKFATQYYTVHQVLTTTQQYNLCEHIKNYINDATDIAYKPAYKDTLNKQKELLSSRDKVFIASLHKDSVFCSSEILHKPLHTLLNKFLENSAIRQLSPSYPIT